MPGAGRGPIGMSQGGHGGGGGRQQRASGGQSACVIRAWCDQGFAGRRGPPRARERGPARGAQDAHPEPAGCMHARGGRRLGARRRRECKSDWGAARPPTMLCCAVEPKALPNKYILRIYYNSCTCRPATLSCRRPAAAGRAASLLRHQTPPAAARQLATPHAALPQTRRARAATPPRRSRPRRNPRRG